MSTAPRLASEPALEPIQRLLDRLERRGYEPRTAGTDKWRSRCPGHQGDSPSLSISVGGNGAVLLNCNRGDGSGKCSAAAIVAELGMELKDLFAPTIALKPSTSKTTRVGWNTHKQAAQWQATKLGAEIAGSWAYHDRESKVYSVIYRLNKPDGKKEFRPVTRDADTGKWLLRDPPQWWPYRIPELIVADVPRVYFLEGEKCTDLATKLGLPSVTTAHGCKSPHKTNLDDLSGREVVILPDVGEAGEGYVTKLVKLLDNLDPPARIKVLRLPDLVDDGDDIEQFVEARQGASAEALRDEIEGLADALPYVNLTDGGGSQGPPIEEPPAGAPAQSIPDRPEIEINTQRHVVVAETIGAIARDPNLYSRGNALVSVVREDRDTLNLTGKTDLKGVAGTPKILELSDAVISCVLTRNASFYQWKADKRGELVAVAAHPSDWLIKAVATFKHWPGLRKLIAVAECPFPRPDGTIVEAAGYDPETQTLYLPSIEFLPVPEHPTRQDAVAAWGQIARVVREFPFASDDDRAVFLAGLLTVLARPAIRGPVPGIAVIGNKAGCGKGLLIDAIGLTAHGRIVPTSNYPGDKEEGAKVKVSIARGAFTIIHFDNVEEGTSYGTSALDSSITSMAVNDRILGSSAHTGDLTLRPAWFLSGNNISPGKDAHRRWLPCNLFTELERPEEREDIEVKDLKAYVLAHRAELVRDALTILRAHAVAERPVGDWAPLGSFEEWDTVVRGAVWFATGRDCNATRRKAADDAPARQAKLALLIGWSELPEGQKLGITAAKAVELAEKSPEIYATLRNALMYFGRDGKLASPRAVGTILRGMKGNLMDGLRFVEAEKEHGAVRWRVDGSNPDTPIPLTKGECGECGECQTADLAGYSDPNNYSSTYACNTRASIGSAETHSPDSPHSPDDDYSGVDWDADLGGPRR